MKEFNLWKELRKKFPPAKIEIVPDHEHDAKVAAQLSAMYNYLMETADFIQEEMIDKRFDEVQNGK